MFDRQALTEAFAGHDAVVNLATAIPPTAKFLQTKAWTENDRVRKQGSAAIVDAAIAAGIERVVQESVSMIYPDRADAWIDEQCPPTPSRWPRRIWPRKPTRTASRAQVAPVWYSVSAGSTDPVQGIVRSFSPWHIVMMMGAPNSYISSIHVADAGAAVVAALAVPVGTYNVVDDEPVTKRSYADALAAAAGKAAWLRIPGRAALLLGNRSTSLTRSLRVSNARLREVSGWRPRYPSVWQGWIATAEALERR
jgi:nucleoside-diphosphate-sugar epimerase